jgi:hypothetical protein
MDAQQQARAAALQAAVAVVAQMNYRQDHHMVQAVEQLTARWERLILTGTYPVDTFRVNHGPGTY